MAVFWATIQCNVEPTGTYFCNSSDRKPKGKVTIICAHNFMFVVVVVVSSVENRVQPSPELIRL